MMMMMMVRWSINSSHHNRYDRTMNPMLATALARLLAFLLSCLTDQEEPQS